MTSSRPLYSNEVIGQHRQSARRHQESRRRQPCDSGGSESRDRLVVVDGRRVFRSLLLRKANRDHRRQWFDAHHIRKLQFLRARVR